MVLAMVSAGALFTGCNSSTPAPQTQAEQPPSAQPAQAPAVKRFPMQGRVVAVDKDDNKMTVQHGDIPGFMSAMTMPYRVKNPQVLSTVKPDDNISGEVVVDDTGAYLDNITVVSKSGQNDKNKPADSSALAPAQK
jgi:protein SCO1/2